VILAIVLFWIELDVRDDDYDRRPPAGRRVYAEQPLAPCHDESYVSVLFPVDLYGLQNGLLHLPGTHGYVEKERLRTPVESIDVFAEPEDPAVVYPQALEDTVSVQEPVVKDRNPGIGPVKVSAVDVYLHGH